VKVRVRVRLFLVLSSWVKAMVRVEVIVRVEVRLNFEVRIRVN
jgi:hypothetical protein